MKLSWSQTMKHVIMLLPTALMLLAVLIASVLSLVAYFDQPLYYNRFSWSPMHSLVARWDRGRLVRERDGTTVLYDEVLEHALIYRPSPGTKDTAAPRGERLPDGRSVAVYVGPNLIVFEARGRLVVLDDTPEVIKSVPIAEATPEERKLIDEAKER